MLCCKRTCEVIVMRCVQLEGIDEIKCSSTFGRRYLVRADGTPVEVSDVGLGDSVLSLDLTEPPVVRVLSVWDEPE